MDQRIKKFSSSEWLKLFLILAFPIHFWIVLLGFQDLAYIIELSSASGGIGFMSYLLLYALIDSLILWIIVALISQLTPKSWTPQFRFLWLSFLGFTITFAAVIEQEALFNFYISTQTLQGISWLSYPVFALAAFIALFGLANWVFPKYVVERFQPIQTRLYSIEGALANLAFFYIFLDLLAFINIIVRNIPAS